MAVRRCTATADVIVTDPSLVKLATISGEPVGVAMDQKEPVHHDDHDPTNCLHCLEGWAPAGSHPVLGPIYRTCPTAPACDACAGTSAFPADFDDPRSLALLLVSQGIAS